MIGFFETFGAGWIFGIEGQIESLGPVVVWTYMFTNFASIIVACGLWFGLKENAVWGGFLGLALVYLTGMTAVFFMLSKKKAESPDKWTWKSIIYEISFSNVMKMRSELVEVVGFVPYLWAAAMKQLIPHIILILFINLARAENADGESLFGHYEGYVTWPFQVLGMLCVAWVLSILLVGFAMPGLFAPADVAHREMKNAQPAEKTLDTSTPSAAAPSNAVDTMKMEASHNVDHSEEEQEA